MTDEKLPPRFDDLSRAEREALLIGYYIERRPVQFWNFNHWMDKENAGCILLNTRYRFAPEPQIPDSINWDHVADGYDTLNRPGSSDNAWVHGLGDAVTATAFASYRRGNMKSCTVKRPGT